MKIVDPDKSNPTATLSLQTHFGVRIGELSLRDIENYIQIYNFEIFEQYYDGYKRKGYGKKLVKRLVRKLKKHNRKHPENRIPYIQTYPQSMRSDLSNTTLCKIYEHLGFIYKNSEADDHLKNIRPMIYKL